MMKQIINDLSNTELALNEENVIFGGRLAEYKYYDMHQVIGSALQKQTGCLELFNEEQ